MKVYVFPADKFGCGRYRLEWPAAALAAAGHQIRIVHQEEANTAIRGTMKGKRMLAVHLPPDCDVVVVQRVTNPYLAQAIPLMRAQGIAVVVDMDDDLTCIDQRNPAWAMLHPQGRTGQSWEHCMEACRDATLVTVSSQKLADVYGTPGRVAVLRNCVPEAYTRITHRDNAAVGWAGSVHSHPSDLQATGNAIDRLVADGHEFRIVGPKLRVAEVLGPALAERVSCAGNIPFDRWPIYVNTLGVGIAPLADTRFNASKSALKPLEYAALGIPSIMSPRAEYTWLHRTHGIGNLAPNQRIWHRLMRDLAANPARRVEESARDRAQVAQHLTIEGNAWRWLEAWEIAFNLQRGHRP